MKTNDIFSTYTLGSTTLSNRIVMAPMTRSRAINNLANKTIATYYEQRAGAGLIVTEGISPSPNGLGYARIPGIYSKEQTQSWKQVTDAVHAAGGKIIAQLMHTGRISHGHNLPAEGRVVGASAIRAEGQMWTDQAGLLDFPVPQALSKEGIEDAKNEFVNAAANAIAAGFDGVELHAANGYLLEQFLSPHANQRTDAYGGSVENRTRFVLEVTEAVANVIGKDKTGIRVSPYSTFNDLPHYPEIDATYTLLAKALNALNIAYVHIVDHGSDEAPNVPTALKKTFRDTFKNTIILTGGYTLAKAVAEIQSGLTDLIGFGKPFISNPDLVYRFQKNLPVNSKLDPATLYTADEKGYTDYPVFSKEAVNAY